ncbi:MXAN_6230/SCO0854 family RING domain-containing protein [Verrucosispora sp. TAA-831]|uniref:MXAN_6230/SCO0854 family RING domain-containing protein n=1 Tax=Verrucosispora sp. TAA-831 TaxID=3422227 RepID=UPI003D6E46B8
MASTTRTETVRARPATLVRVLLRRRGVVYPGPGADRFNPDAHAGVTVLEADLADRGWLLSPALRDALLRLDTADLVGVGTRLLADCDELVGAARTYQPLFRRFPDDVPANTLGLYIGRILARLFQVPEQPCVLCSTVGTVQPVNPCAHLVCTSCFDPAVFSGCPICHRHIDPADPYLAVRDEAVPQQRRPVDAPGPTRLRVLHLGGPLRDDVRAELLGLLARPSALSPADNDDLALLLAAEDRGDVSWLPETVPGRETKARLLAWLLTAPIDLAAVEAHVMALVGTATDVLRLLVALSGGESLIGRPRLAPVSRPVRRALLAALDRIGPVQLVEDMRRHRRAWIAVGERLHPGEYAHRWPSVAVAFAALRGTSLDRHPAGETITALVDGRPRGLWIEGGRLRVDTHGRYVEESLASGDTGLLLTRLVNRPGEMLRRADHLLRTAPVPHLADQAVDALGFAARKAAPAVVLSALGAIRTRSEQRFSRVFWPAGRSGRAHVIPDNRAPLPGRVVQGVEAALTGALIERAAALPAVDRAVVDTALDGVVAPFAERTASRSLVTLARGSVLPIPQGQVLRLFTHWMETPEQRVDLDLSVAIYDERRGRIGQCDYTNLRWMDGAVHSGDWTSAPAPHGSAEFVDLDMEAMRRQGARWAVMSLFSFNNVRFTDMAEAFAGFMLRDSLGKRRDVFEARAVEQRFDLTGPGTVTIPLVVDLEQRTMRWLDVEAHVTGTYHSVARHGDRIAEIVGALDASFAAGGRVTLGELGRWIAAARAREVIVRGPDGMGLFRRGEQESVAAFAERLRGGSGAEQASPEDAATAELQLLLRGDLPVPDGAEVFALHPAGLDAGRVRLLAASDVPAMLAAPAV